MLTVSNHGGYEPGHYQPYEEDALSSIAARLSAATGTKFEDYSRKVLGRQVRHHMDLRKIPAIQEYVSYLQDHPEELSLLANRILVHVTGFFRDPECFESLEREVIPALVDTRDASKPIQVWIPGCATGEEAYTAAMCLLDRMRMKDKTIPLRIIGTDLRDEALAVARRGVYAARKIEREIPLERRRRYLNPLNGNYEVTPPLREVCQFVRHDLTSEPPLSDNDLVVCRNLLIYFERSAQIRIARALIDSLRTGGYLMLGKSESLLGVQDGFAAVDARHRIFCKDSQPIIPGPRGF